MLPPGDVLIHAGDLTDEGSFDEIQAGLSWLSSQPHKYKIFVAGNHDVLLDEAFLEKYPERRYGQAKTIHDLEWGSVTYLRDSSVTLEFSHQDSEVSNGGDRPLIRHRHLSVFGSPWTPQYGVSAFQYRPDDHQHWSSRFSTLERRTDIVVTHGPPRLHLDTRGFHRAGCPYLAEEMSDIRPRLVVFGHIHASYGREDVVLDMAQRAYEDIMAGWAGWDAVVWMAMLVFWSRLKGLVTGRALNREDLTTFVNASVVGGPNNELRNPPIVLEM